MVKSDLAIIICKLKMKIKNRNKFKERILSKIKRIIARLENENNCNLSSNGEANFIEMWSRVTQDDPVIFDIGANQGDYVELVLNKLKESGAKKSQTIYAFEPSLAFLILQDRFKDNSEIPVYGDKNSESVPIGLNLLNFGLSDVEEMRDLYFPLNQAGGELSSLYDRSILGEKTTERVSLKRLDNFIENKKIPHISLMKIDVEGHELQVLRGMGKYLDPSFVDYIQFEYGGCNVDSGTSLNELYDILVKAGFIMTKIMPTFLEKRGYSKSLENYTHKNFVAISKRANGFF